MRRVTPPRLLIAAALLGAAWPLLAARSDDAIGFVVWVASIALAFVAGRASSRPAGLGAVTLLMAGVVVGQIVSPDGGSLVPELMLPPALYLAGYALRAREHLAADLRDQGEQLEAERDAYTQLSIRYERARIAAELHDVVAHAISVMVVQAGAGQRLAVVAPERLDETFSVIATAARQAQTDLDHLAGLLLQDDGGPDARLEVVREIVDQARAAGLPVTFTLEGDESGVRGEVAHVALRVVQEGLTNALRYAPGAPVEVSMRARPASLEVSVTNTAPATSPALRLGSGRGLTGLRERVAGCGGTVRAGPQDAGGWALQARMPY